MAPDLHRPQPPQTPAHGPRLTRQAWRQPAHAAFADDSRRRHSCDSLPLPPPHRLKTHTGWGYTAWSPGRSCGPARRATSSSATIRAPSTSPPKRPPPRPTPPVWLTHPTSSHPAPDPAEPTPAGPPARPPPAAATPATRRAVHCARDCGSKSKARKPQPRRSSEATGSRTLHRNARSETAGPDQRNTARTWCVAASADRLFGGQVAGQAGNRSGGIPARRGSCDACGW